MKVKFSFTLSDLNTDPEKMAEELDAILHENDLWPDPDEKGVLVKWEKMD